MILVAIPYWKAADYIEEAVASVLRQTHRDLTVLVAGDGEVPPVRSRDRRLRVVAFERNAGAPLTQQAMLLGSPHEWYAAMGADDWIEPDYLERLLELGGKANGSAALYEFSGEDSWIVRDFVHVEFGVFDAETLRSVGGYGIDRRCGQDTLLYHDILPSHCDIRWSHEPRYHKRLHEGSLMSSPETRLGSAYRDEVVVHNRRVADHCSTFGSDLAALRAYRESLATSDQAAELAHRVEVVRAALA